MRIGRSEWVERARDLGPILEQYRDQSEQQRRMAPATFEAIEHSGILEMTTPHAFGGPQAGAVAQAQLVEELARHDASAAWNVYIWSGSGVFADYLPESTARDMLGVGQHGIVGGSFATGRAQPVEGGFRVSGRWPFASGCHYLTWFVACCVVMDGDQPRTLEGGAPDIQLVFMPAAACQIIDTWRSAGMRGTGSHDFSVDDVFVPAERTFPFVKLLTGPDVRPSTAYPWPFVNLETPPMAAIGLGIARDAIESFKVLAARKTPSVATTALARQHTIQERVARAEALLRSARAYLYATMEDFVAPECDGASELTDRCAAVRLATAHCAQNAVEAVDLVFDAAGGTSVYESSRLERCFRDVHMITHHIGASPTNFEMVGQFLLGGPLELRR
jgi:alkylation response protein AidB-like acyl-CoA dehydrogenase